jgi:hypothetical protein
MVFKELCYVIGHGLSDLFGPTSLLTTLCYRFFLLTHVPRFDMLSTYRLL